MDAGDRYRAKRSSEVMDSQFKYLSISDSGPQLPATTNGATSSAVRRRFSKFVNKHLNRILFLASAGDGSRDEHNLEVARYTARATAQVSRRWRAAAVNTPSIWLGPVLSWYSHPNWLDVVLERSKPLLLDAVILDGAVTRKPQILPIVLGRISRIRRLDLTIDLTREPLLWQSIGKLKLLQQQAPCLQSLCLNVVTDVETRGRIHVTEPENLFSGWAPMLHHLRVQDCPINLAPKMYSGLRVLFLHHTPFTSPVQVLDALRNMKYLENFYLVCPPGNVHLILDCPDVPPVYLLNLNRLRVAATTSMCTSIFKHLYLPPSCSIQLDCHQVYGGQHSREILSRMKETLSNWKCEPLTGTQYLDIGATHIRLAVEGPMEVDDFSNLQHPYVGLAFFWQPSPISFQSLFSLFPLVTSSFPKCTASPDSLHVNADTKIPAGLRPLVANWLRSQQDIQAIEFRSHDAFAFFEPILRLPKSNTYHEDEDDDYNSQGDSDILLPILGDLRLENVNFNTDKRRYWKRLIKTLKGRDKAGCPIQQLDLVCCGGDYSLNEANRYVADVKEDGESHYDDNDDEGSDDSDCTIQANSDIE
ncbi:hypothetical protein GALMADRAFT_136746 [Galerina marginata CBS 339.88]|uniref:F-box domain-containing protein n=1 Tax=Galerina marginata (strain CBS 339.88) TaxID=685588 RepID=A0A067TAH6_GALM3|nr:hypothetical protein GALMADRAFT_136746 [Galerina marginata CBS 339.88]